MTMSRSEGYAGINASRRNLITARMASTTKIAIAPSSAIANGGSDWVGAIALRAGTF